MTECPNRISLGQYFTPDWAAECLMEQFFPGLSGSDFVVEPSCGRGAFLKAIPESVPALGVEIDPQLAREAAVTTGRPVICGDFTRVPLPTQPTCIVGNPPFQSDAVHAFLTRAKRELPRGGRAGFILPAFLFHYAPVVMRWASQWSLQQVMIPRGLFPGLSYSLNFVLFTNEVRRKWFGFALYSELAEIQALGDRAQGILREGGRRRGVWFEAVAAALTGLGGSATLEAIYAALANYRPTGNVWWKEKVRQTLRQTEFRRVSIGYYSFNLESIDASCY